MFPSISTKCERFLVTSQPSSPRPSPSWKLNRASSWIFIGKTWVCATLHIQSRIYLNCFAWFRLLVPNFGGIVGKDGPSFLVEPQIAGWQCRCNVGKDWSCLNSDVSTCQNRGTVCLIQHTGLHWRFQQNVADTIFWYTNAILDMSVFSMPFWNNTVSNGTGTVINLQDTRPASQPQQQWWQCPPWQFRYFTGILDILDMAIFRRRQYFDHHIPFSLAPCTCREDCPAKSRTCSYSSIQETAEISALHEPLRASIWTPQCCGLNTHIRKVWLCNTRENEPAGTAGRFPCLRRIRTM